MRELKFLAYYGLNIRYDVTGLEHGTKNEMAGVFLDVDYYSMDKDSLSAACDERHAVVVQFIGRRDRNGKEIYEGARISDHNGEGVVEFVEDAAAYRVNYKNGTAKWFIDYLDSEKKTIEIIGHVLEPGATQ